MNCVHISITQQNQTQNIFERSLDTTWKTKSQNAKSYLVLSHLL